MALLQQYDPILGATSALPVNVEQPNPLPTTGTTTLIGTVSTKTPLTASAPTFVSVGVASGVAVAANLNRTGLALVNLSGNDISFAVGTAAVLDSGITLKPNGVWEMDEFTFTTGEIRAIASGAASILAVQEFTT